jgi:hypothetical protein
MAEFAKGFKVPSVCLPQRAFSCGFEQHYFMSNSAAIELELKLKSGIFGTLSVGIIEWHHRYQATLPTIVLDQKNHAPPPTRSNCIINFLSI